MKMTSHLQGNACFSFSNREYHQDQKKTFSNFPIFSKIWGYSSTNTIDAVYIIGGYSTSNVVAQFKENQWHQLPNLQQGRQGHGSITIGSQTIIVGGSSIEKYVLTRFRCDMSHMRSSAEIPGTDRFIFH